MDSGFYAASAGLRAQSEALEVSAHNLANLNTTGFRGQEATFQSLVASTGEMQLSIVPSASRMVIGNALNYATNDFGVLQGTRLDLSSGSLLPTGNPLDVAVIGSGFFAVLTPRGVRYTRNGSFKVSSTGELVTENGDRVLGNIQLKEKGTITIPPGAVSIAGDGTISVNGAVAGKIQLVDFAAGTPLASEGETLLSAPEGSAQAVAQPEMKQGTLESSNVNSINAIVSLIGVQRQAEMMQHCMSLFDSELNATAARDLAKV